MATVKYRIVDLNLEKSAFSIKDCQLWKTIPSGIKVITTEVKFRLKENQAVPEIAISLQQ